MGKYKNLGKNVLLMTVGNFASKMMSFFLIPFYTAILTTEEYGISDLMTTTVNLLLPFLTLLMSEAVMRFALDKNNDATSVFTTGLTVTLFGTALFLVLSPLALLYQSIAHYYVYFVVYYIVVALHTTISYFVRGIDKVGIYTISGMLQTLFFLILNILFLAVIKIGIKGYLLSMILGHVISIICLIAGTKLYKYVKPSSFDRVLLRKMLAYSVPMIPNSLSWWISNSSDKYLITFFCGVTLTGVYSVSQRIPSLFATISTIFMGAWQISAVEDWGSEQTRKFFSEVYNRYSVLNNVIVSGLIFLAKIMARILFSKDFYDGWFYVSILLFAFLFHAMSSFFGSIYTSAKKTKMLFSSTLAGALLNIVFNIIMIPLWGGIGAAVATFISYFAIWVIRLVDSRKILIMDLRLTRDTLCYLLIVLQIIVIMLDMNIVSPVVSGVIFVGIILINLKEIVDAFKKILKNYCGNNKKHE